MIALFTDFGVAGPYVGQLHAQLATQAPGVAVIDLFHDVPNYDIRAAAYLLPAYTRGFPPGTVFLCVVDPGVGGVRRPVMIQADDRWYVGPDNGLFEMLVRRAVHSESHEIHWRPTVLSSSFHGRDLFAPVAARLSFGQLPAHAPVMLTSPVPAWPDDLPQVLYIDRFGNAISGLRAQSVAYSGQLRIGSAILPNASTFSAVGEGEGFWYENANGLVEIAANRGRACDVFGITVGTSIDVI